MYLIITTALLYLQSLSLPSILPSSFPEAPAFGPITDELVEVPHTPVPLNDLRTFASASGSPNFYSSVTKLVESCLFATKLQTLDFLALETDLNRFPADHRLF